MRAAMILAAAASTLAMAGAAQAEPSVVIRNAAVRVVVIPEARKDVQVIVAQSNGALPLRTWREGDRVIVDGGVGGRMRWLALGFGLGCSGRGGHVRVHVPRIGWLDGDALPRLVVRAPLNAEVAAEGAVFGSVGRSDSLTLSNAGCGDWTVANVRGPLTVNEAGSGDVRAGASGGLTVHSAGSGDVSARSVAGPMEASIAGSGDVIVARLTGALEVSIAGSGSVQIANGEVSTMTVHIAGSGGVDVAGTARSLDASIAGSGDVRVGQVLGPVSRHIMGSGSIDIGS